MTQPNPARTLWAGAAARPYCREKSCLPALTGKSYAALDPFYLPTVNSRFHRNLG